MADLLGNILVGYAAAAWAQGFRAEDRTMIGMLLSVRDEDLDIICALLTKWEKEEAGGDNNDQVRTNGDKIRAMSDSELANMLSSIWICHHFDSCEKCPLAEAENCRADGVKQWLRSEVRNE